MDNYFGHHNQFPQPPPQYIPTYEHQHAPPFSDFSSSYSQPLPPNSNDTHDNYQRLLNSYHEVTQQNRYLNEVITTKDSGLQIFKDNEVYLRAELDSLQQKCSSQEQNILNLSDQLEFLKSSTVAKTRHDEILKQNETEVENNQILRHQNEELVTEANVQHQILQSLQAENVRLFGENRVLHEEKVEVEEKLKSEIEKSNMLLNNCDDLNEKVKQLEENLEMEQKKVASLEEKLSCSENSYKEELEELLDKLSKANAQTLVLNSEFKSSCKEINLLRDKNHEIIQEYRKLENEKEQLQEEKEQLHEEKAEISSKNLEEIKKLKERLRRKGVQQSGEDFEMLHNNHEILKQEFHKLKQQLESESERARQANLIVHEQRNKIDRLSKRYEDQKLRMERKSNFIAALKKLLTKTENEGKEAIAAMKELKVEVEGLKLEKDYLNGQLDYRLAEVGRLKSEIDVLNQQRGPNFTEEIQELQLTNKKLAGQLEKNGKMITTLEDEIKEQKLLVGIRNQSLESLGLAKDAKISELEEKAMEMSSKLEEQEKSISNKAGRVKLLLNQLRYREQDNAELQREVNRLKARGQSYDRYQSRCKKTR